jgi:hypothetical protein
MRKQEKEGSPYEWEKVADFDNGGMFGWCAWWSIRWSIDINDW